MRLRVKSPEKTIIINITGDNPCLIDLQTEIKSKFDGKEATEILVGYPPKRVSLEDPSSTLQDIGIRSGDQLVISLSEDLNKIQSQETPTITSALPPSTTKRAFRQTPEQEEYRRKKSTSKPINSGTRENKNQEVPSVTCGEDGVLVLRVMEDDNSCLFRSIGYNLLKNLDSMHELRSLVASDIASDNGTQWSDAVLDRPRDEYCAWIQADQSWGGGIELAILANHFGVTLLSVDVMSGRVDEFNPGKPTFCVVMYSGIHYDAVALSPFPDAPPEYDTTVFDNNLAGDLVRVAASELATKLRNKHYYTDTATFTLQCQDCGAKLSGERTATKHAEETGHSNFGEVDAV